MHSASLPGSVEKSGKVSETAKSALPPISTTQPTPPGRAKMEYYPYLQQCHLLQDLSTTELDVLVDSVSVRTLARGDVLYAEGDYSDQVFLITKGRVRLTHEAHDKKTALLDFVESLDVLGALSVYMETPQTERAEAAERTELLEIPRNVFLNLVRQNEQVARRLLRQFAHQLTLSQSRLKSTLFGSSRDRLMDMLKQIALRHGTKVPGGTLIDRKYSHQDLANMIGATRETVTITLGELQNQDLLMIDRRRITLLGDS